MKRLLIDNDETNLEQWFYNDLAYCGCKKYIDRDGQIKEIKELGDVVIGMIVEEDESPFPNPNPLYVSKEKGGLDWMRRADTLSYNPVDNSVTDGVNKSELFTWASWGKVVYISTKTGEKLEQYSGESDFESCLVVGKHDRE